MKTETEKVLETLQNDYNINLDKIQLSETNSDKVDYIQVDDTLYHIHKGMSDNEIAETASYIYNNLSDEFKEQQVAESLDNINDENNVIDNNQQVISESLKNIKVGEIYLYEPEGINFTELEDSENFENEAELFKIADFKPFCRVKDVLIVSKEEEDGFVLVTFDIPENEEKQLSQIVDVRGKEYVVFESDLKPVSNKPEEEVVTEEKISEMVTETADTPYIVKDYIVDGDEIDLVCYDTEVDEEYYKYIGELTDREGCLRNMQTVTKDTTLSITPKLYDEIVNFINNAPISGEEQPVAEDLEQPMLEVSAEPVISDTTPQQETSVNLLTALESEKQAVLVYEALIKIATDEKEIELLNKILTDEKEHIALLSSLQTTQVADFVAEDNKAELDENAQDVIDTPAMSE